MSDTVKIKVSVRTDKVGSKCTDTFEVERDEWDSMSDADKEAICRDVAFNYFEWYWEECDE